jgi:Flp pilus assembly protein TadG
MLHPVPANARRRAATVPLFAILLVPLLGMLAFSIDIGYMVLVRTDLQTAADAAALAGAEKLQQLYVQYTLPGQTSQTSILNKATTNTGTQDCPMYAAELIANYNKAGNVFIAVPDADVSFSYLDAQGTSHSDYSNYNGGFPNSITVITRRDGVANGPLSLFFGPLLGMSTKSLMATATATIYSGDVTSLQVISGVNAHILPVALDMNIWKTFFATGKSPDGSVHLTVQGNPQLKVYPTDTNTPGSFGLIDVGPPQNNAPAFRSWIDYGDTPNDISYMLNNNLLPVSPSSPKSWKVGPGMTSTLQTDFYSQMGVPNLIPLVEPATAPAGWGWTALTSGDSYTMGSGTGQNALYAVVGFVGVTISQADARGSNMDISVQPYAVVDPTAVITNPRPVGTQTSQFGSSTVITTFISAKLTR